MTAKGDKKYMEALLTERAGHEAAGRTERVKQVDAELKRVGGSATRRGSTASTGSDDQGEA